MENLYSSIANVTAEEISDVLDAVLRRYAELFPGWEVSTISIEKSGSRSEQIDNMIQVMEKLKTSP